MGRRRRWILLTARFTVFERQEDGSFLVTLEADWADSPSLASAASSFCLGISFACDETAEEILAADATLRVTHAPVAFAANPLSGQAEPAQSVPL